LFSKPGLIATGINRQRLREPIPATYWEMATLDPSQFRERHYVSFIDDILGTYGGQLTPVGEDSPRWFGIRVDRDAMLAAFPDIAAALKAGPRPERAEPLPEKDKVAGGKKLTAALEALSALYPADIPSGLTDKELLTAVNTWLKGKGNSTIAPRTLSRAKSDYMRS
jgi:hypothetical protein